MHVCSYRDNHNNGLYYHDKRLHKPRKLFSTNVGSHLLQSLSVINIKVNTKYIQVEQKIFNLKTGVGIDLCNKK